MSESSTRLLQLLEPAVRPGPGSIAPGPQRADQGAAPFESKPFEQLLRELGEPDQADPAAATRPAEDAEPTHDPLASLRGVENASIARLLADQTKT